MKNRTLTLISVLLATTSLLAAIPSFADNGGNNDGGQQKITVHVGTVTKNPDQGGKQGGQGDGGKKSQGNGGDEGGGGGGNRNGNGGGGGR